MRVFILASLATTTIAASNGAAKPAAKAADNNTASDGSPFAILLAGAQQPQSPSATTPAAHAATPPSQHAENSTDAGKSGAGKNDTTADSAAPATKPAKDDSAANDNGKSDPNAQPATAQSATAPQPDASMLPALQVQLAAQLPVQIPNAPQLPAANDDSDTGSDDMSISGIGAANAPAQPGAGTPIANSPQAAAATPPSGQDPANTSPQASLPVQAGGVAQTDSAPQAAAPSQPNATPQTDGNAPPTAANNAAQTAAAQTGTDATPAPVQDFVSQFAAFAGPAGAPKTNSSSSNSSPAASAKSAAASAAPSPASSAPLAVPPAPQGINPLAASTPAKNSGAPAAKDADKITTQNSDGTDPSAGKDAPQAAAQPQQAQPQQPQAPQPAPNPPLGVAAAAQPGAPIQAAAGNAVATSVHIAAQTPTPDLGSLAVAIAARSQSGARQFDIRLDPPELGRVEVRLSIDASGKAEAHMSADQAQTLSLLQKDSTSLTQALRDAGLNVSDNGLNFSLRGQGGQQGQAGNGQQNQGRANFVATQVIEPAQGPSSHSFQTGDGRLDISV